MHDRVLLPDGDQAAQGRSVQQDKHTARTGLRRSIPMSKTPCQPDAGTQAGARLHDGVALANVGQELVAQALALARALHQARDVHKLHRGGDHRL